MRDEDPLESWLLFDRLFEAAAVRKQVHAQARAALKRLADLLEYTGPKKADLAESGVHPLVSRALAPADLPLACDLYRKLVSRGGRGSTYVQEGLIELIASTKDPTSIPFWQEILEIRRPRDTFGERRRTCALAALARIAVATKADAALEALLTSVRNPLPEIRALSVLYLGRACLEIGDSLPPAVETEFLEIAQHDSAFGPRFQARAGLRAAGKPAPLDNPGGVFSFKISLGRGWKEYRTIAVRSEQTLEDLHFAIQGAIHWDADHLYTFFLNGKLYDQRYAFACPYESGDPPFANEAAVGGLGLTVRHEFLYLFDYGDHHEFQVRVDAIQPKAGKGSYPRVIESRGKAPEQYPNWE